MCTSQGGENERGREGGGSFLAQRIHGQQMTDHHAEGNEEDCEKRMSLHIRDPKLYVHDLEREYAQRLGLERKARSEALSILP